jgi:hypothetical protein
MREMKRRRTVIAFDRIDSREIYDVNPQAHHAG